MTEALTKGYLQRVVIAAEDTHAGVVVPEDRVRTGGVSTHQTSIESVAVLNANQLTAQCAYIIGFEGHILGQRILEAEVLLHVIGCHEILVHVSWHWLRQTVREGHRADEECIAGERHRQQPRSLHWPKSCTALEQTGKFVRKVRRIEADVFENVVVDTVVECSESSSHHQLLISQHVISEADPRGKVVQVLVP